MSSADTTRLLVLGVAQLFEPANGYQLRRELLSWSVEHWANINPGSIYSMLATLTKQGMLERHDIVATPSARAVAVYRSTEAGRTELVELVRTGIREIRAFDRTEFYAAMSLVPMVLPREEVATLVDERIDNLLANNAQGQNRVDFLDDDPGTPPHVTRLMGYGAALGAAELEWLRGFAASVRAGELVFAGEDAMEGWQPAADDPAWRMVREREIYLSKLAES